MTRTLLLGLLWLPPTAAAGDFVFTPGAIGAWTVDLEALTGSRDAGAYTRHGEEGRLRAQFAPAANWTVDARAGWVRNEVTDATENSFALEARAQLFDSGFFAGAGYRRDYDRVSIPYGRLGWTQSDTAHPFAATAVVELPQATERDSADVLVSAAQALPCGERLHCALELAGEDLEGFFQDTEAEGGAKFILGPTLDYALDASRSLRLFAGWIHAATANEPARPDAPDYRGHRDGAMLRLALRFGA